MNTNASTVQCNVLDSANMKYGSEFYVVNKRDNVIGTLGELGSS